VEGETRALEDRVCLVTGGSSGIGAACVRLMAERGARVMLTGRSAGRAADVAEGIRSSGGEAAVAVGDLRDPQFCDVLVDETLSRFGRLDVLVNNAGIYIAASATDTTDEQWHETLDTNLGAAFRLSRAALRIMVPQGRGVIVNVASDWGLVGGRNAAAYCASKGGLVLLTRALALEHARNGIRINAICPTDTDTPMMQAEFQQRGISAEEGSREAAAAIPMGRMADEREVAEAVCFLASDAASFMTGIALPIDGGSTAGSL
jgi:meso-butanediol dehydrogenase/(S,S)-butanediol dehydrogenase/diacetyl reductase